MLNFLRPFLLSLTSVVSAAAAEVSIEKPFGLAVAPKGRLWITEYKSGQIDVVSPSGTILKRLNVPSTPTQPAFSGNLAILSGEYDQHFYAVNRTNYTIAYRTAIASDHVANVAVGPNGLGYVTYDPGSIAVFNPDTGVILSTFDTTTKPRGLAFSADGSVLATVSRKRNVMEIFSTAPGNPLEFAVPIGKSPRDVVINGPLAFAANLNSNTVSEVNWKTGRLVATIPVGEQPRRLVTYGKRVFVGNQLGSISVLNVNTNTVIRTIKTGAEIVNIGISPNGRTLYAGAYKTNELLSFDVAKKKRMPPPGPSPPAPPPSATAAAQPRTHRSNFLSRVNIDVMFTLISWRF
jgi:YVTN family beta-propeller protein